jgi:hypothetical protein
MDEATGAKIAGFTQIQDLLSGFRAVLAAYAQA